VNEEASRDMTGEADGKNPGVDSTNPGVDSTLYVLCAVL